VSAKGEECGAVAQEKEGRGKEKEGYGNCKEDKKGKVWGEEVKGEREVGRGRREEGGKGWRRGGSGGGRRRRVIGEGKKGEWGEREREKKRGIERRARRK